MPYLSPVTTTDRCSLSTKLTGNISPKLSSIFQYFSRQSPSGSHVFHGEIMYTYSTVAQTLSKYAVFVPLSPSSTEFCKILRKNRNSTEMGKFRGSAQNSAFREKLWSLVIFIVSILTGLTKTLYIILDTMPLYSGISSI